MKPVYLSAGYANAQKENVLFFIMKMTVFLIETAPDAIYDSGGSNIYRLIGRKRHEAV
ncbi:MULTISPECIES: hypothetical protein [Anaerotruncus]|uniref:Uncharacterized protein n=1 Tax=Anaerotruncus massiliensis (ex Togo et al. 2019) TaxID=1673720 RepID=A0ABR7AD67_9FIRM|nr:MULTISPECIES: hypothetical protein [Anaerotruncus]MBC3938312.1 hypothetical protein [Anaerotruncus massiliensis (ex Togo et al. 2019)]MCQ4894973.1 hypothetical protein [Anaerotruncus sp. DFI.9.16]